MRYVVSLDGLRACAVLAVVAFHLSDSVPGGFLGVDVFFVLSGYLITSTLLSEWDKRGGVSLGSFYMRRALRLLPALAVVVAGVALVAAVIDRDWSHPTLLGLPWVVLYSSNWRLAFGSPTTLGVLQHTWSLAIEEQFYLVWPVIFLALVRVRSRRRTAAGLLLGAVVVMLWRAVLWRTGHGGLRVANGLDSHSDGLLLGCALSFYLSTRPRSLHRALSAGGWLALSALGLMMVTVSESTPRASQLGYAAAALCTVVAVWSLVLAPPGLLARVLSAPVLVWIGRRSYGLYLWHPPVFAVMSSLSGPVATIGKLAVAAAVTALSYRLIEAPALRLKARWASDRTDAHEGRLASVSAPTI